MAQSAGGRLAETGMRAEGECLPASVGPLFFQSRVPATTVRLARLAVAVLASGAAAVGAAGCGGPHPRPAALRLERADLVLLAHTLQRLEAPVRGEVGAARAVWPAVAGGLPASLSPAMRLAIAAAERRAEALAPPWYVTTEEGGLTGPAVIVGGLLKSYAGLTRHGWQYIAAALAAESAAPAQGAGKTAARGAAASETLGAGSAQGGGTTAGRGKGTTAAAARFLRANAGLYIYCVYDGHYDLSLIGKSLQNAYRKLGGAPRFGGSLTQGQVEALARAYSIPSSRLTPRPPPGLAV